MKRLVALTVVIASLFNTSVFAAGRYDNEYMDLKTKVTAGSLMIEARSIFEKMGYEVSWDSITKVTVFSNGENIVNMSASTGEITINGNAVQLQAKPVVENGVTYIPASLLDELDVEMDWDYENAYPLFYSKDFETTTEKVTEETTEETTVKAVSKHKNSSKKETTEATTEEATETTTGFTGWNENKDEYYYKGSKVNGLQYVDGKMYNFIDGTLKTGIFSDEYGVHGFDEYGNPYNGFLTYEGKKYYFDNGNAYTVPTAIKGKMYNFSSEGCFNVGWVEENGEKLYFNEFGYGAEGIVEIDGNKYCFVNGVMQKGAVTYNNNNYLFNDDGTMVVNQQVGDIYYGADGIGVKYSQAYIDLQNKANSILAQIGTSPQAIFNYVSGHIKYKFMAQQDWTTMANTGFNTGRGACYNYAACVDILLKNAGYETRVVRGTGHYTSLHYWNQVKINGAWTNIDACNKYYNVSDAYLKSKNFTFDKYEYPTYY